MLASLSRAKSEVGLGAPPCVRAAGTLCACFIYLLARGKAVLFVYILYMPGRLYHQIYVRPASFLEGRSSIVIFSRCPASSTSKSVCEKGKRTSGIVVLGGGVLSHPLMANRVSPLPHPFFRGVEGGIMLFFRRVGVGGGCADHSHPVSRDSTNVGRSRTFSSLCAHARCICTCFY